MAINAYFQHGVLPPPGTVCDPDLVPFDKFNMTEVGSGTASPDEELTFAMLSLMKAPVIKP